MAAQMIEEYLDQNYVNLKIVMPDSKEAEEQIAEIQQDEPYLTYESVVGEEAETMKHTFELRCIGEYYRLVKMANVNNYDKKAIFMGEYFFLTTELAQSFFLMSDFHAYVKNYGVSLNIKYRQSRRYQFRFRRAALYGVSRYFAKNNIFAKIYAGDAFPGGWLGEDFLSMTIKSKILAPHY